jgi:hypothetical protein
MKKSFAAIAGLMALSACILISCLEELDNLDRIEGSAFEPTIDFPLINSEFSMQELLTDGESKARITDVGGVLVATYDDTVSTPDGSLFFVVPSQSSPTLTINGPEVSFPSPGGSISITKEVAFDFNTSNGEVLDSILLNAGQLLLNIQSTMPANVSLAINIPTIQIQRTPFSQVITLNGASSQTPNTSLANAVLDLTKNLETNTATTNTVTFEIVATITDTGTPINASHSLSVSFGLNSLGFTGLFGDLGTRSAPFEADSINVDVFDNAFDGTVTLLAPALRLDMINSFGLPIGFDIQDISGVKEGQPTLALSGTAVSSPLNPYLLAAPDYLQVGEEVVSSINITPSNSNLPALISSLPKFLAYKFNVSLNPDGSSHQNFVLNTSRLKVGLHLELPFHGSVSEIVLRKRYDFGGLGVDDIDNSKIKLKTSNESPLDIRVQVYFVDASGTVLDSLFMDPRILKAAPVGADGFSTGPASVTQEVSVTKAKIDRMESAEFIEMVATVYTTNNGTVPVKFGVTDKINMTMGVSTKMKYSTK